MRFQKKWGAVGWPEPQARRLEHWCERWGIEYDYSIAETGSRYYTLYGIDGTYLQVRIADHGDLYGRTDISWDPTDDAWPEIRSWIRAHGMRPVRWGERIAQKLTNKLQAALPQYTVKLRHGLYDSFITIVDSQQFVLAQIMRNGLHVENFCPAEVRDILMRLVPVQFQPQDDDNS